MEVCECLIVLPKLFEIAIFCYDYIATIMQGVLLKCFGEREF